MADPETEAATAAAAQSQKQLQHKIQLGKLQEGSKDTMTGFLVVGVARQVQQQQPQLGAQSQPHSINNLHKKRPEKLQWPAKCQSAQFWCSFYLYPVKRNAERVDSMKGMLF